MADENNTEWVRQAEYVLRFIESQLETNKDFRVCFSDMKTRLTRMETEAKVRAWINGLIITATLSAVVYLLTKG